MKPRHISTSLLALASLCALPTASAQAATEQVVLSYAVRGNFFSRLAVEGFGKPWKVPAGSYQIRNSGTGSASSPANRAYFGFDLASVQGTITGATLRIEHPGNSYDSSDSSETINFRSIENWSAQQLENPPGFGSKDPSDLQTLDSIFADLGDGELYGSLQATLSDKGTIEEVSLTAAAIAELNAAAGTSNIWVMGSELATGNATALGQVECVFRGSDKSQGTDRLTELVLTVERVPNSAPVLGWFALPLLGLGLTGASAGAWRKRRS